MSTTTHGTTIVYVDTARDRNHTMSGRQLLMRVCRRVFGLAAVAAGGGCLPWVGGSPPARLVTGLLVAFLAFSVAFFILYGGGLLGDYQVKEQLADKYGFDRRFGLDTYQRRVLRIVSPPADLPQRISEALKAIAIDAKIQQVGANRIEAKLQTRKSKRLGCRVTIQVDGDNEEARTVTIESRLTEPLGWTGKDLKVP
jgi:hypothetical protein